MKHLKQYKIFESVDSHRQNLGSYLFDRITDKEKRKNIEKIKQLIDDGADVNYKGSYAWTSLIYAAQEGYTEIVKILIAAGADINQPQATGYTPLMKAAMSNKLNIVNILINAGADINLKDDDGRTALYHASWNNCPDIAKILINAGADLLIKDTDGIDFITCVNTLNNHWLDDKDVQEMILSKEPILIKSFIDNGIVLDPDIKKKYAHLLFADDVGLLQ